MPSCWIVCIPSAIACWVRSLVEARRTTAAEDFSHYGRRVPALFLFLGVTPAGELATAAGLHSPLFTIDESALPTGVRVFVHLAADYLFAPAR